MTIVPSHRTRSLCSECRWLTAATPSDKARPDNGWRGGRVRDLDWRLQARRPFRRWPRSPCWSCGNVGDSCSPRWSVRYNVEAQRSIFRGGIPGSSGMFWFLRSRSGKTEDVALVNEIAQRPWLSSREASRIFCGIRVGAEGMPVPQRPRKLPRSTTYVETSFRVKTFRKNGGPYWNIAIWVNYDLWKLPLCRTRLLIILNLIWIWCRTID